MPVSDGVSGDDAELIAAAETAASWVRARRATWATEPLPSPATPSADFEFLPSASPDAVSQPLAAVASAALEAVVPEIAAPVERPAPLAVSPATQIAVPPAAVEKPRAAPAREWSPAAKRWAAVGAIAAAVIAAAAIGGPYVWNGISTSLTPSAAVAPAPDAGPALPPPKAAGGLRVTSTPTGAQVIVDGKSRGATPLSLTDISPGKHEVALTSAEGTVRRSVTIAANEVATIDEAIFAGWVAVYSPLDLTIAERGRVLKADERNQVMLPAGTHELRFSNRPLGYDVTRQVEVKPGEATKLQLTPEPSTLTVTASAAAEVWIDGTRIGETPLNAAPMPLGTHDIVVKRAAGGERRFTVTVGVKPTTLNVEF